MVKYDWVGKSRDPSELSHSQQLFQAATNNSFTIGDGGSMGLYVGENLAQGETKRCATFENEPLTCSDEIDFDISVVEVIAFCWKWTGALPNRILLCFSFSPVHSCVTTITSIIIPTTTTTLCSPTLFSHSPFLCSPFSFLTASLSFTYTSNPPTYHPPPKPRLRTEHKSLI